MAPRLEILDDQPTALGALVLRRRRSPSLGEARVYEVTLDGAFLMSSAVIDSEVALATLAMTRWERGLGERDGAAADRPCDVLVGGLGLGYTALAALAERRVRRVRVIEWLRPVLDWYERRLVPAAEALLADPRCTLIHDDFFRCVAEPVNAEGTERTDDGRSDLILLDIDHSPDALLDAAHGRFYEQGGLASLAEHLRGDGVFALWSAAPPPDDLIARLKTHFSEVTVHPVRYEHPMLHHMEENTVVVAHRPRQRDERDTSRR